MTYLVASNLVVVSVLTLAHQQALVAMPLGEIQDLMALALPLALPLLEETLAAMV